MGEKLNSETQMKSKALRIASILAWSWGVLLCLAAASIAYPFIAQNQSTPLLVIYLMIMLFVSLIMCISGYGVWTQKKPFHKIAIGASIVLLVYSFFFQTKISILSILVGVSILIIVTVNRKSFT